MAAILTPPASTIASTGKSSPPSRDRSASRTGLRESFKKWKNLLKGPSRPASPSSTSTSTSAFRPNQPTVSRTAPSSRPPTPPINLFAPTTETIIHSPFDPRNARSQSNSVSSSTHSTLRKRPSRLRRNTSATEHAFPPSTAPTATSRLGSITNGSTTIDDVDTLPLNTITTTITANAPRKPRTRYRLSLSRRSISHSYGTSPPVPQPGSVTRAASSLGLRRATMDVPMHYVRDDVSHNDEQPRGREAKEGERRKDIKEWSQEIEQQSRRRNNRMQETAQAQEQVQETDGIGTTHNDEAEAEMKRETDAARLEKLKKQIMKADLGHGPGASTVITSGGMGGGI